MHKKLGISSTIREYLKLEEEMREQVDRDNRIMRDVGGKCVYLPCMRPKGKVDFIFVAMEPRIERWVPFKKFEELCGKGFVNFIGDMYCAAVHHSIWRALEIQEFSRYHITDLSKGAMSTRLADIKRNERYERWKPLLKKEIEILSKHHVTEVIALGEEARIVVGEIIGKNPLTLYHYSRVNTHFKNKIVRNGWEQEYNRLNKAQLKKDIVTFNKNELLPLLPPEVMDMEEGDGLHLIKRESGNQSFEPIFMRSFVYQHELQHLKQPLTTFG